MTKAQDKFQALLDEMPPADADFFKVLSWSQRFNAYDHWGSGPELLHDLLLPLLNEFEEHGGFVSRPGCDAIRAFMFYKAREHHFTDNDPSELLRYFAGMRAYVRCRVTNPE